MKYSLEIIKACLTNSKGERMKQHIKKIGLEYEAKFQHGITYSYEIKEDGSVKFTDSNGDDIDHEDCNCFDYCSCAECRICDNCGNRSYNCDCDSCHFCVDCNSSRDNGCECEIIKCSDCPNKKTCLVGDNEPCEYCIDNHYCNVEYELRCDSITECDHDCDCYCSCGNSLIGEIATKPLNLEEIENVNNEIYEGIDQLNSSCGFHIHLDMDNQKIHVLCTQEFYDYFLREITTWANKNNINSGSRFWNRLSGAEYAQRRFYPQQLEDQGECNRYTHVNFCSFFRHSTLEIRLAPQWNCKEIALSYVYEVYRIVNEYLDNNKPKTYTYKFQNTKNDITLKFKQEKEGLKLFAKSKTLGKMNNENSELSDCDQVLGNTKARFFNMNIYANNSFNVSDHEYNKRLNVYDSQIENVIPNMKFLCLQGLEHGNSFYFKGVYTIRQIEKYFENMQDYFDYVTRTLIE